MCAHSPDPSSDATNGLSIDIIIDKYEGYVRRLVSKHFPRHTIRLDELEMEIDEVVQVILVKFWQMLMQKPIANYASYLQSMVRNEAVNVVRRFRFHQVLNVDEEGEPYYGVVLFAHDEDARDPGEIVAEKETVSEYINHVVVACLKLPPLQRYAMLCILKDRIDYHHELLDAFRTHHIDITQLRWSGNHDTIHSMRVSASIGRKKLRAMLMNPINSLLIVY